jgi:protein TonB
VVQPQPKVQPKAVTPKPVQPTPAPAVTPQPTPVPLAIAPSAVAPKVEMPSSDAAYLNNPLPAYPSMSKRLGEQGKVVVRVLISPDGQASQASVKTSSGSDRLDQAAVTTVLKWRYVPGKRGGVPEAMWFDVPVNWTLQ